MKKKVNIWLIAAIVLTLQACKTQPPVVPVPVKTIERKVTTLVPVYIPGDSASLLAYFECDSMNNVLLKWLDEEKSKNMYSDLKFVGGLLNYRAKSQPDTVYLPSDTIYTEKELPFFVEVPKIEYRQNWLQQTSSIIGFIALLYILIRFIWKRLK